MITKLVTIAIALGLLALALLVVRQQRIDTVHHMADTHRQVLLNQRRLWEMRREITERTQPQAISEMMQHIEIDWNPIPMTAPPEARTPAAESSATLHPTDGDPPESIRG